MTDVGKGQSRDLVAKRGLSGVYVDWLAQLDRTLSARGKRMMFWGDFAESQIMAELYGQVLQNEGCDVSFQLHYGRRLYRLKGTADHWTPLEQIWVAEKARRSGRGFSPWPNTARLCGAL